MDAWRTMFRKGVAPALGRPGVEALLAGLESDDPTLIQGATTSPPPMRCVLDWPVEAACAVGYAGWKGDGLGTVGEVEAFYARICSDADQLIEEPAAMRYFLNWFDDTPRDEMRRELTQEARRWLTTI